MDDQDKTYAHVFDVFALFLAIVQLKNIDEKTEQLNKLIKKYNEETEKWTS